MSLLVVGSIAFDTIKTPHGGKDNALGGSAVYFSLAASLHGDGVRLVGVVGDDFGDAPVEMLRGKAVDTSGLEVVSGGETFRWSGEYMPNMNDRETLEVDLNVLENFQPKIPQTFIDSEYVFLANGAPVTQLSVLDQVTSPKLVVADTMDLWINIARDDLLALLKRIDGLVINDSESHLLTGSHNVVEAGRKILEMGPKFLVLKKGEHGAILFKDDQVVPFPAYPTSDVADPTGAGDSFAGAMMGYLASQGGAATLSDLKRSIVHGTVAASFTVEDYGVDRIHGVGKPEVSGRFDQYCDFLRI